MKSVKNMIPTSVKEFIKTFMRRFRYTRSLLKSRISDTMLSKEAIIEGLEALNIRRDEYRLLFTAPLATWYLLMADR